MSAAPNPSANLWEQTKASYKTIAVALEASKELAIWTTRTFPEAKEAISEGLIRIIRAALKTYLDVTGQPLDLSKLQPTDQKPE